MRMILPALLAATMLATPALAQGVTGVSTTNAAGVTTTVFSVSPRHRVAAADYVKWSADTLNYRIAASTLAVRKAERADVKAFANADLRAAKREQGALFAGLNNKDRRITKPSSSLSTKAASSIELLKKAPKSAFDNLYLTQVADAMPTMWGLQKGYAEDGADPVLRQVASISVPSLERNYTNVKSLMPVGVANAR